MGGGLRWLGVGEGGVGEGEGIEVVGVGGRGLTDTDMYRSSCGGKRYL